MKIRKGDTVQIRTGVSRGKTGKVIRALLDVRRVVVEGVHLQKKHVRPRRAGQKGQVIEFPSSIDVSNVALLCLKCGKPTRVAVSMKGGEKKTRVCKKCGQNID